MSTVNGLDTSASPTDNNDSTVDVNEASSTSTAGSEGSAPQSNADGTSGNSGNAQKETAADAIKAALGIDNKEAENVEDNAALQNDKTDQTKSSAAEKVDATPGKDTPAEKVVENPLYKEPDGLAKESSARFKSLVDGHKEISAKLQAIENETAQYRQDSDAYRQAIDYSGATPDEFRELLVYSNLVKSGRADEALEILDKHRSRLAKYVGKPVAGENQLEDFPDLQEKVDGYTLPIEDALEIAASRRHKAQAAEERQRQEKANHQQQSQQAGTETAIAKITALGNKWAAEDIDYAVKEPNLVAQAKHIAKTYPPHLWEQALTDYYQSLKHVAPKPTPSDTFQPLRPNGGKGGKAEPRNTVDAVTQALGLG